MVKFAVFFVAALAFHGIFAAPNQQQQEQLQLQLQQQQQQAQQLLNQIQSSSNSAISSVQSIQSQLDNYQIRQYLSSQANDYVYYIQNIAYNLQQAIQNYQGQQYLQEVQQIYRRLTEIAYSVQQAINSQPHQLLALLQNNIQNVATEAQRLTQIVQQLQQNPQAQQLQQNQQQGQQSQQLSQQEQLQQQYYLNYEAIQALYRILASSQRLQAQYQLRNQNQEQIRSLIQLQISQVSTSLQSITANNEQNAQYLANQANQLSRNIGYIIYRLQRQLYNYPQGESRNVIQQVANKLSEIRGALEQSANSQQYADTQAQVQQLQNRLRTNINGAAVQIERLLELSQPSNLSNSQGQELNNLVNNIVADGLSILQNLQSQLQIYIQTNPTNL